MTFTFQELIQKVELTKKERLIAVSYPRYSKLTLTAAKMAHHAGAKIIVITDTPTAPLALFPSFPTNAVSTRL